MKDSFLERSVSPEVSAPRSLEPFYKIALTKNTDRVIEPSVVSEEQAELLRLTCARPNMTNPGLNC